eukprot:gene14540-16043_t
MTGEAISNKILDGIAKLSLDMNVCRGQGYGVAANMSGKCAGAAARITRVFPKAPYVHCASHDLNLVVASACDTPLVKNMMSTARVVLHFFNVSPNRFAFLAENIKAILPTASHTHHIDVCRTRWLAEIDGLDVFGQVFLPALHALEKMEYQYCTQCQRPFPLVINIPVHCSTNCRVQVSRDNEATNKAASGCINRCNSSK